MEDLATRKAERERRAKTGPDAVVIEKDDKNDPAYAKPVNPNQEPDIPPVRNKYPGASQIPDPANYEEKVKGNAPANAASQALADEAAATAGAMAGNGGGSWGAPAAKTTAKKQ